MSGFMEQPATIPILSEKLNQTLSVCLICPEISGNGQMTGMLSAIIAKAHV